MTTLPKEKIEHQPMFICGAVHRLFRNRATTLLSKQKLMTLEMSRALVAVQENQPLSQQQLADIVQNERSATKRMVDNLEERGYLTTSKSATNKKLKMLNLTKLGEDELKKVKSTITDIEKEVFECLSKEEYEEFLRLIRIIGAYNLG
ncbi:MULTISPECIES: MarR family winged helix-turn-helix transcriptional regulator [unclassified Agarivorans]|uniref:MarR family winged helix-turn-helix transcriptional regulator n=1 Tax=unclassified Agarivorans TaxID=2636026 RepID=UPI0010F83898|nr:MarR family winged helix-turn-helix transcriptional regulator [Agarivorans sp. Toyoura001]